MNYNTFLSIANIMDTNMRIKKYIDHYKSCSINGLHYVNFLSRSNTISISMPDHFTHHESTSFLIMRKNDGLSINTVRGEANDIKKFLDFLLIWNINILDMDLLIILIGFIDYLRIIQIKDHEFNKIPRKVIEWSLFTKLPLNMHANNNEKLINIGFNKEGFMHNFNLSNANNDLIEKVISTVLQFLVFLHQRTVTYKNLSLNYIPVKEKHLKNLLSGTLGSRKITIFDIQALLRKAGIRKRKKRRYNILLRDKVFSITEIDTFLGYIPKKHRQNLSLFYVLRFFGLRASEAANLMIDITTLPKDILLMEHFQAKEYLKANLRGDIEYVPSIENWVCTVVERENPDFRSQHKSGRREIPLLFSSELFLDLLIDALRERQLLVRYTKKQHCFLFVSRSNQSRGNPITGQSINKKYSYYSNKLLKDLGVDLTLFSPHSFRHFYATYLLRVKNQDILDVSRWLGHADESTTRSIYSHYLPRRDKDKKATSEMLNYFENTEK